MYDHPRTVDDEQIMACVESGGVIGLTGLGIFLGDPQASVEAFVRQIDYLAERAGTAHIGLGLDTELHLDVKGLSEDVNEEDWWPKAFYGGITGHRQLQPEAQGLVAEALLRRGYDAAQIDGIFGGNFMRIAQATWPVAVGTAVACRPPHRSVRAELPHTAPALGT